MTEINKCNEIRNEDKQLTKSPVNPYLDLLSSISIIKNELEDARQKYQVEAVLNHFFEIIGNSFASNPDSPLHDDWTIVM